MHVCITYDSGSTANNPVAYINGVSVTVNRIVGPAGSFANDAATNLLVGLNPDNSGDYDGRISHFCYDNAVWTAAQANRACWWGEPGGAVKVKHRLTTDKLTNEGTATADATATGATMGAPIGCPVSPKGSVLMGMGVGW